MRLSPHFTLAEFTKSDTASKLGIKNEPTTDHLKNIVATAEGMERVRALLLHKSIRVTSGYRSPALNKAVGGVPNSDHALGWACDFVCPAFGDSYRVALAIAASGLAYDQLIQEKGVWVHISFNPRMRQQEMTYDGKNYLPGIREVRA